MPYYQWTGMSIDGEVKRGKQLASSSQLLERELLQQNIALMKVAPVRNWPWQRWRQSDSLDFFRQLSALMHAGIFTTDALAILLKQPCKDTVRTVLEQISVDIGNGIPLSDALEKYNAQFNSLIITLIRSGEESGNSARALQVVCEHIEFKQQFYRKLRAAALMPLITMTFFLGVGLVIIGVILPKFAVLFAEARQPLPWMTRTLLLWGENIHTVCGIGMSGGLSLFFVSRYTKKWYPATGRFLLSVPFVASLTVDIALTHFLKALTILMQGGVPLVQALTMAQHSVSTVAIKNELAAVVEKVAGGMSLSDALQESESVFFRDDFVAMIRVGEESGALASMVEHCSIVYERRVDKALNLWSALFQPALMIVIGLMITFLIVSVYVPIFELSNVISWV